MTARRYLALTLALMAALYAAWFARDPHLLAGLLLLACPPALLAIAAWHGWHRAGFVAAMLALVWFSHGVMLAWSEPAVRGRAVLAIALSLLVIHAACLPGMQARRARRRQ